MHFDGDAYGKNGQKKMQNKFKNEDNHKMNLMYEVKLIFFTHFNSTIVCVCIVIVSIQN